MAGLFLANRELITKTLEDTHFTERVFKQPPEKPAALEPETPPQETAPVSVVPSTRPPPPQTNPAPAVSPAPASPSQPASSARPETAPVVPAPRRPAPESASRPSQPSATQTPSSSRPAETTRERALYFVQIGSNGAISGAKVSRRLPVSDTPMQDVLRAVLAGPTAEERGRGIQSLIPSGSRLLGAEVRDNTARINFSEEFRFGEYGMEGYRAQLRQIIWTVTEFANVKDVQFLIEGQRVEYLSETAWIGTPLNRNSP